MRSQLQAYLNFCAYYQFSPFYWADCGKPSYKMDSFFLLAQIALWRVQRVRKM